LAELVMRLFAVNAAKFGMPYASIVPTIRNVISNSYNVKPVWVRFFMQPIYCAGFRASQATDERPDQPDRRSIQRA
jgi:hypothetical protein